MDSAGQIKQLITKGLTTDAITEAEKQLASEQQTEQNKIEIFYMLIVAYRFENQLEKAIKTAEQLLASAPEHARTYQELGYLHSTLGNQQQAAISFYKATQLNPALVASWKALIAIYAEQGNSKAKDIAISQIEYLSSLPQPILGARDLMYEGQLHKADQVCRKFLQQHPHDAEAMLLLAEIGINLKIYGEAEFILESCIALHPNHFKASIEYLRLLAKMGKFEAAKQLADKMIQRYSNNIQLLSAKASAQVAIGELEPAINIYRGILNENATLPNIHLLLGHALKAKGDFSAAIESYQAAYANKPEFGDAYWSLANTKTYQFKDDEIENMRRLTKTDISIDDQIHIHFALGKALEDRQQYDESFFYYDAGNRLKHNQTPFNSDHFDKQVEAQISVFSKAVFDKFSNAGATAADPIFIVGLPRAGSTLLEQILASHSQVDGTMELHNVLGLVSKLHGKEVPYPANLIELDLHYFKKFGEKYLTDTKVYRQSAPFFIDKMPNNFLHIGLIKLMLPNAKIIDARRHPMACCFSGFKQLFGEGQEFTYSLHSVARYYKAYQRVMKHWDEVLPGFVLRVNYENVIDDLEGQVTRVLEFCELPFEQSCIDFHKTKRVIKTPSSEQVRQPIYRSGVEQWQHFEAHLAPLKKELVELL